jgi:uncharacterized protein (DUF2141 family)
MTSIIKVITILFLTSATIILHKPIQDRGILKIEIVGIRNNNGRIGINIYNSKEGFPNEHSKAIKTEFIPIKNNEATITFTHLKEGYYAVSIFHDENNNKKIETNWIGIPREGVGASNNAKGKFGPPKFIDAKFMLDDKEQTVIILVAYL